MDDVGSERLSWSEFRSIVEWMPPTEVSALHRARYPKSWWWTPGHDFFAAQLFSLQGANWQRSGGEGPQPELVLRPREDWELARAEVASDEEPAMDLDDLREHFASMEIPVADALDPVVVQRKKVVRLTADDVVLIKQLLAERVPQKSIAAEFGVSVGCISSICRGRTWSHIGG